MEEVTPNNGEKPDEKKPELTPVPPPPPDEFDDPLSKLLSLQVVDGLPMHPRCKFCKSKHKRAAEDVYDKSHNTGEVKKFLDAQGDVIDLSNISNHIKHHYKNMEATAYMLEYAENARGLMEHRRSETKEADLACTVALMELARILAIQSNGDISREKERNEMYCKSMREYRAEREFRKGLRDEDMRIRALKEKVLQTWRAQIESAKSPEQKEALREMLKNFKATYETL